MVPRATWAGSVSLPSYVQMYIYVLDKMAAKPLHRGLRSLVRVDRHGSDRQHPHVPRLPIRSFILILPDNPGQKLLGRGSDKSLMHDGGGDTHRHHG